MEIVKRNLNETDAHWNEPHYVYFREVLATLTEEQRKVASDVYSSCDNNGRWQIRDWNGKFVCLARHPSSEPPVVEKAPDYGNANMHRIAEATAKQFCEAANKALVTALVEVFDDIRKRLESIEQNKAIDAEVIDELAGCLERVEMIEAQTGVRRKSLDGGSEPGPGLAPMIADAVATYMAEHPVKDGRGTASALIDHDGVLVLTMTDGSVERLGRVMGKDGFGVESRDLQYVPESHEIVERWTAGGRTKEIRYPAGGIHDAGYWREGMHVRACQVVTQAGSLWIALRDNRVKPCMENKDDWRIAARAGRDCQGGKPGPAGEPRK